MNSRNALVRAQSVDITADPVIRDRLMQMGLIGAGAGIIGTPAINVMQGEQELPVSNGMATAIATSALGGGIGALGGMAYNDYESRQRVQDAEQNLRRMKTDKSGRSMQGLADASNRVKIEKANRLTGRGKRAQQGAAATAGAVSLINLINALGYQGE